MNQIAAHYRDGRVVKGHTNDFLPAKESFHLEPMDSPAGVKPVEQLRDFALRRRHK